MRRHRTTSKGQSLVEFAFLVPLLLLLFAGVWTAADLISNTNTAGQASRNGARLAAQVGNNGYRATNLPAACQTSAQDPCDVDRAVVLAMQPVLQRMTNASIQEIDIYRPQPCAAGATFPQCPPNNGSYQSGDLLDRYHPDGTPFAGTPPQYTLNYRTQVHPTEASVGVAVRFHYTSPSMSLFSKDMTEYTVIRLAPEFS